MAWLPRGEKNFEDIFIRFGATDERDRQTDGHTGGQTPHADIYRAYAYASRGKNWTIGYWQKLCSDEKVPVYFLAHSVSLLTHRAHCYAFLMHTS